MLFVRRHENSGCSARLTRRASNELICKYSVDYKIYSRYYEFEEFWKLKNRNDMKKEVGN